MPWQNVMGRGNLYFSVYYLLFTKNWPGSILPRGAYYPTPPNEGITYAEAEPFLLLPLIRGIDLACQGYPRIILNCAILCAILYYFFKPWRGNP